MGSTFILKVRTCLKSPLLPSSVHFFCTRRFKHYLGGRQMDRGNTIMSGGQGGLRIKNIIQGRVDGFCKKSSVSKRLPFSKSVFAAGTAKRVAEASRKKASLDSVDEEEPAPNTPHLQPPDRPLSPAEWRDLKESLENPERFDSRMMVELVKSGSEPDIAKSLLTFVAVETGSLSYLVLLRYLHLCVDRGHDDEVLCVYNIMRGNFPSLDTGAYSLFIKSFSRTERWKEAFKILQEYKKVLTPTPANYGDIVAGAVQHGDMTTAWALYDEMIEMGLTPSSNAWESLFAGPKKTNEEEVVQDTEQQERLQGILLYMRSNQIYPQLSVASKIKTWFESLAGQNWTGAWTTVTPTGRCNCCRSQLESIQLSAEEYQKLKDSVMVNVIQGKDIFKKTNPEELKRFKTFVANKPPFDVVIDGLNIGNIRDGRVHSETLLDLVSELHSLGLKVLVLGKMHMLRPSYFWNKHNMTLIKEKAHCFFTDNMSKDDPFLLYATLNSGNHCQFVSKDLMRDHKACLPDEPTRSLFFKWQRGHQLVVDGAIKEGRRIKFHRIFSCDTIVQTTGDSWHIPYDDIEERSTYEVPLRWLCLTKKNKDCVNENI